MNEASLCHDCTSDHHCKSHSWPSHSGQDIDQDVEILASIDSYVLVLKIGATSSVSDRATRLNQTLCDEMQGGNPESLDRHPVM